MMPPYRALVDASVAFLRLPLSRHDFDVAVIYDAILRVTCYDAMPRADCRHDISRFSMPLFFALMLLPPYAITPCRLSAADTIAIIMLLFRHLACLCHDDDACAA